MFNQYPYTDFHEMNLDWVIKKINEFDAKIETFESSILDQAHKYTDEQITIRLASVESQFEVFKNEVNNAIAGIDGRFDEFVATVNARMAITEANFRELERKVNNVLASANEYTNYAIQQNNEYIIDATTKALDTVTVLNYFTGARVSIQAMFDYLAQFHLTNAINVDQLVARSKTVQQLIDYNMTMTDLATNGGSIIQ